MIRMCCILNTYINKEDYKCKSCLKKYICEGQHEFNCKHNEYMYYCVDVFYENPHWKLQYVCSNCGFTSELALERCPSCNERML